ncbi:MAG: hypothetical protein J4445_00830 [DPANN group archaeon]|nr:hypothetical protein [DPANN group archaeon]
MCKRQGMSRKVIFGIIATVIVVAILIIISQLPEKELLECKDDDGTCPANCKFDLDNDCIETGTISLGEIKSCLADTDCAVVKPICGNLQCTFTEKQCKTDNFCETAISTKFLKVWNEAEIECSDGTPICGEQILQTSCYRGECRVIY